MTSRHWTLLISLAAAASTIVRAEWPAKVFAPYMYIGQGDQFKLTDCCEACGLKYYTLAFIIARQERVDKDQVTYHREPSWDGRIPIERALYKDQIEGIRKRGGDVIMSFGGEAGKELANVMTIRPNSPPPTRKSSTSTGSPGSISTSKATIWKRANATASAATPSSPACNSETRG